MKGINTAHKDNSASTMHLNRQLLLAQIVIISCDLFSDTDD